jgi:hypothetical protein
MHEINFIDKSFDQDTQGTYNISLQANQSGLTYCIYDVETNLYVLFRRHRFEQVVLVEDLIRKIAGVFKTDETLSFQFHTVRVLAYTRQTTLVPEAFFEGHKMRDYLMFNHAGDVDHELFNNHITPPAIHNVFALSRELVSSMMLHFKRAEFLNQTTPFLRHISHVQDAFMKPAVYVGLNPDFFDIACTGEGKLKLYNTFQYANENDLLYYVVFICNQMGFDTRNIPLNLSGELSSKISYYEILRQYIPNTRYDEVAGIPSLAPGLRQLNPVRFLNLLNLQMCVSSAEHIGVEK